MVFTIVINIDVVEAFFHFIFLFLLLSIKMHGVA